MADADEGLTKLNPKETEFDDRKSTWTTIYILYIIFIRIYYCTHSFKNLL